VSEANEDMSARTVERAEGFLSSAVAVTT